MTGPVAKPENTTKQFLKTSFIVYFSSFVKRLPEIV